MKKESQNSAGSPPHVGSVVTPVGRIYIRDEDVAFSKSSKVTTVCHGEMLTLTRVTARKRPDFNGGHRKTYDIEFLTRNVEHLKFSYESNNFSWFFETVIT